VDRFTLRGLIYSAISVAGIGYELFFSHPVRPLLIIGYVFVIGIGMIYIFILKDKKYGETES
jgi:hypothetical protein